MIEDVKKELKNIGALSGLSVDKERAFPKEFDEFYRDQIISLTDSYNNHRKDLENAIQKAKESLENSEKKLECAAKQVEQLIKNWGSSFIAGFLIWAGFQNIVALPSIIRNLNSTKPDLSLISISLIINNVINVLNGNKTVGYIYLGIIFLLIIIPSLAMFFKKARTDYIIQLKISNVRTFGTIALIISTIVLLNSEQKKMLDSEFAFAIMASILGLSSLVIMILIYFKMKNETLESSRNSMPDQPTVIAQCDCRRK